MRTLSFSSPYSLKTLTARNRVIIPPMASSTADEQGFATQKTIEHYRRLAEAQAGIIFVEYTFVHLSGRSDLHQLGADSDEKIPGLKQLAAEIRSSGALAGLQLVHAGGRASSTLTGAPPLGPSQIRVPVKDQELELPQAMSEEQIAEYVEWYVQAAQRAEFAGFNIVELHSAHGYGLNQWLSPLTNERSDQYGGSRENRARLLFTILKRLRSELQPTTLLAVRLPGQDHAPNGLSAEDMQWVARQLEAQNLADLLDVSSGIGGWRRPQARAGEGYLVSDASQLKTATQLPIIGVGGIESTGYIDHALNQGWLDFAAVGRKILNDPAAWNQLTRQS